MIRSGLERDEGGVSPVVAIIILLTIIMTITAGILYWGHSQINSMQARSDMGQVQSEMQGLNQRINALTLEPEGNTVLAPYNIPSGELLHIDDAQAMVLRAESRVQDVRDDFEDGEAEAFTPTMGTMTVETGKMKLVSGGTYGIAFAQTPRFKDMEVQVNVKLLQSTLNSHWCGVYLRAPSISSNPTGQGYSIMYARDGTLLIMENGVVVDSTSTGSSPLTESTLKIDVRDRNITVRVNGALYLTYTSPSRLPAGYTALCVGGGGVSATFDNVVIHPLGRLWSPTPSNWLSGPLYYNGSGDYAIITYPEIDTQDWAYYGEVPWHYRVPIDVQAGKGTAKHLALDFEVPFSSLLPVGEKLDRNSIRVTTADGTEIPYQFGPYKGDDALLTPSTSTGTGYSISTPGGSDGGGVLATDGKYLYVKRWGTLGGSQRFQRIGTGLYGTEKGKIYGVINSPYRTDTISAFYLHGYIYNGYTPDGTSLERIDPETGVLDTLALSSPLIDRTTGTDLSGGSTNILITTDGEHIICVSTGINGGLNNGYRFKMYDPNSGTLLTDFSFGASPSITAEGAVCYNGNLVLIGNMGTVVRFSLEPGHLGDNYTLWAFPANDGGMVGGQYDTVNRMIWLTSKSGALIKTYEGYMPKRIVIIPPNPITPYSHQRYYVYFDTYSHGIKDAPSFAVEDPPEVIENLPLKDYTLENKRLRVSMCEGPPPNGGSYRDHIYEVFDRATGRDLQRSGMHWGWMVYYWNYGGFTGSPYNGITDLVVVSRGPNMVELKMVQNHTNFLYERYYTVYRGCPYVRIEHRITARNAFAGGVIYTASWWNPGRGDNNYQAVDSAYGIGGHDFGSNANPLGKSYTSNEYTGLGWRNPSADEMAESWYAQWNETNGEGIGTVWSRGITYRYYSSPTSNNEGRGVYLRLSAPGLAEGQVYDVQVYGYIFKESDGREVEDFADALHNLKCTVGEREELPYEKVDIVSYPQDITPTKAYSALVINVYFNDTTYPIYTTHIYGIDAIVHDTYINKKKAHVFEMMGGVFTDFPTTPKAISDPAITVDRATGTLTAKTLAFHSKYGISGMSVGKYTILLEMDKRVSYIFTAPENVTLGVYATMEAWGYMSDALYAYLYGPYFDSMDKGSSTVFQGFEPWDVHDPNTLAVYSGDLDVMKITYIDIGYHISSMG